MQLPSPLVSTEWLSAHLDDPRLRLFDTSVYMVAQPGGGMRTESGRAQWQQAHIPGADFLDMLSEFSDNSQPAPVMMPTPDRFAALCSRHGLGDDSAVVLYAAQGPAWAARMWWMLRSMGFGNAAVLDGGWEKWQREGRPTSAEHQAYAAATFTPRAQPQRWASKQEVLQAIHNPAVCTINALMPEVYDGRMNRFGRPGHIPGSHNVFHAQLMDAASGTFLPADALRQRLDAVGAFPRRALAYCGSGVTACVDALALTLLGHGDVAVYDGSMAEWAQDPALPLVPGSAPG